MWSTEALTFLSAREDRNRGRLKHLDLIGELGTTSEELDLLSLAIRRLVLEGGPRGATKLLGERFPVCLAEFLVACGTYDYHQGNYWSSVVGRTGLPSQNYPSEWGELFEKALVRFRLERFPSLDDEGATRYVSRILAHGGIPLSCLDDFFEYLILPTALAGDHHVAPPSQLIQSWNTSRRILERLDKPLRRFLVYGGSIAEDILGRCLEMADLAIRDQNALDAQVLGLPKQVVDRFIAWFAQRGAAKLSSRDLTGRHLHPPRISYDPWAPDALSLILPAQTLPMAAGQARWVISTGVTTRALETRCIRRGEQVSVAEAEVRLPRPFASLEVAFEVANERLLFVRLPGISKQRPYLAFYPETGLNVESGSLPRGELWLITERSASVRVQAGVERAGVRVLEELPFLSGEWSSFRAQHIDLTECDLLLLEQGRNSPVVAADIRATRQPQRAQLVGGQRSPLASAAGTDHAFVGRPPHLLLPLPVRSGVQTSSDRWLVRVRSLPGSHPRLEVTFSGDDPFLVVSKSGTELLIDLSSPQLLGSEPLGTFEIVARGPLGRDARFELVFLPELKIEGLELPLLPDSDGPVPVRLWIRTTDRLELKSMADSDVTVTKLAEGHFRVEGSRRVNRLGLIARDSRRHGHDQGLLIDLPLRRVRWGVTDLSEHLYELVDHPLIVSQDELQQADAPALVVAVTDGREAIQIGAHVEDAQGRVVFRFEPRETSNGRRFPLHALLNTLRARNDARLHLMVSVVGGRPLSSLGVTTGVILTKELRVSELSASDVLIGAIRRVQLRWTERQPVSNRIVRFWPLWRPWDPHPREYEIDDAARGEYEVQTPRPLLPAGQYRVELTVRDPWVRPTPSAVPRPDAGNVADVTIGSTEEHAEYLDELPRDQPLGILERFLATRNPMALAQLAETLDEHDVPAAVHAALGFIDVQHTGAFSTGSFAFLALHELCSVLIERAELLPAIVELSGFDTSVDHRLRRLIVELGLLRRSVSDSPLSRLTERHRVALWRLWGPLLLALDGERLLSGDAAFEAMALTLLGVNEHVETERGTDALGRIGCAIGPGFQPSGTELSLDLETLKGIRQAYGIDPTGPLDPEAWTLANLDWLIRLRSDLDMTKRAEAWVRSHLHLAHEDLTALSRAGLHDAVTHVERRWPTADHGPLRMLPFIVGATALMERALARNVVDHSALLGEATRGYHPAREAFSAAVELYSRDLCVMDILILSTRR